MHLKDLLIETKLINYISQLDRLEEELSNSINDNNLLSKLYELNESEHIPGCGIQMNIGYFDDVLAQPKGERKNFLENKFKSISLEKLEPACNRMLAHIKIRLDKFDNINDIINDIKAAIKAKNTPKDEEKDPYEGTFCALPNIKGVATKLNNIASEIFKIIAAQPSLVNQKMVRAFKEIITKIDPKRINEKTDTMKALADCDNNAAQNLLKQIHKFRANLVLVVTDLKKKFDKDPRNDTSNNAKRLAKKITDVVVKIDS